MISIVESAVRLRVLQIVTLILMAVTLPGCLSGQTQRQSAITGIEWSVLVYELSGRRFQRCRAGLVEPLARYSGCAGEHQARVEALSKAHPFIVAATNVAMSAPNQPADSNLAQAREILVAAQIALLSVATDSELEQFTWLGDEA